MDSLLPDAPERNDTANRPLDRSARAAVTALARALEVFDRPAARRAALRAHLADRIAVAAGTPVQDRVDAITGSLKEGGLQQVDSGGDIYVTYHLSAKDNTVYNTTGFGYGGYHRGWGGWGGGMSTSTTTATPGPSGPTVTSYQARAGFPVNIAILSRLLYRHRVAAAPACRRPPGAIARPSRHRT